MDQLVDGFVTQAVAASRRAAARRIVLLYASAAAAWLAVSNVLVFLALLESSASVMFSLAKGGLFIATTSTVLYWLLSGHPAMEAMSLHWGLADEKPGHRIPPAVVLFLALAAVMIGASILVFQHESKEGRDIARNELTKRAEYKAKIVGAWLRERVLSVQRLERARILQDELPLIHQGNERARARLESRFEQLRKTFALDALFVVDPAGRVLALAGAQPAIPAEMMAELGEAARTGEPRLQRIYRATDAPGAPVFLDQIMPIELGTGGAAISALIVARGNLKGLNSIMQEQDSVQGQDHAESLLVRRAGDRIQFLSDLRHRPDAALRFSLPADDPGLAAANLVRGKGFVGTASDYRGVRVLAAAHPVPGTDWHMVAKVDLAEVLEDAYAETRILAALIAGLTLLSALGAGLLWRQRVRLLALRERALRAERDALGEHIDLFAKYSNDMVLLLSAEGRILKANDRAVDRYGYPREELLGKNISDLRATAEGESTEERTATAIRDGSIIFESMHRSRSGEAFPVEMSVRRIDADNTLFLQAIGRDISNSKRAARALRASEQRFRDVLEQSIAAVYVIQDKKIVYVNPRMREIFGYAPDEAYDPDPMARVVPEDRSRVAEEMARRFGSEHQAAYTIAVTRKDGTPFSLGVHSRLASYDGRPAIIAMAQDITEKVHAEEEIKRYVARLEQAMQSTIDVVATIGELRDPYTHGHERRVGEIAAAIATEMGLDASRVEGVKVAGYLHDVGKIGVPAEILAKPTKLTKVEFDLVKEHAQKSYEILKDLQFPWPVAETAWQHHERLDGSGYPRGLKGDQIILEARIMSVADVLEAMASHRPYRPGLGVEKALSEIERGSGTVYDPIVVAACLRLYRDKGHALPA